MLNFLLIISFSYFGIAQSSPYASPRNDFIELIEVLEKGDSLVYYISANSDSNVLYKKIWKNDTVIMEDSVQDADVISFRRFQKELDSTSGRWLVEGIIVSRKDQKDLAKKFLKDIYRVSWMIPSKAKIKRSKSARIIPASGIENDFYPVVLDLQKWIRNKFR